MSRLMLIRLHEKELMTKASAYVENGILKKWRYYNLDENHIDQILHYKQRNGELLTEEELNYIRFKVDRSVIVTDDQVIFNNFSSGILRF